jgi:small ligand-binding sensory domain FIST
VTRLILGILPDKSGIVLFETDFEAGEEILFMLRDTKTIIDSARTNTENIFREIKEKGKTPRWGFYIDCAGRREASSEAATDEAAEVQSVFNAGNVPLFGFYSGVEIAPFVKKTRGLDWTGVLIMFSQ